MLTADLVHARRRKGELVLTSFDGAARARAVDVAREIVDAVTAHVGRTRAELDLALAAIDVPARDKRIKDGLVKLALDRCDLDGDESFDAPALRRALFTRAAQVRRALGDADSFRREEVVAEVARAEALLPEALERALFADLREAHQLRHFEPITAMALVDSWGPAQAQAVLLRAVRVTIDVECASAGAARALFRRLKFLRLLFSIERAESNRSAWRIAIDGPFSLFESVTKYGLQLALVLPVLDACERWKLSADLRWGKTREALVFHAAGGAARATGPRGARDEAPLPDEVAALVHAFRALENGWRVSPAAEVLDLPGVGVAIPDLVFEKDGAKVLLEVMGYWSRDAVWRRVELVEKGLRARIIFAVSERLRVSEEVLAGDLPGALYVYKGTMSARAIAERISILIKRPPA